MSRALTPVRPGARRLLAGALCASLMAGLAVPALAQELPPCSDERTSECSLPDWSDVAQRDLPSLFGEIDGAVWMEDDPGDAPAGGLDILGAGAGRVVIDKPAPMRESDALLKLGKAKKAVPAGESVLVRIVLDRPPSEAAGGHASVHLATDVDGSRSSNVPSAVSAPDFPFAGSQDVYTLSWASTTGKTRLLSSDLAQGWYEGKQPFAASWAAPNVLDLLVAPSAFGEGFRVITHAAGSSGGYDVLALGPAPLPADGNVGLVPVCIEGSISTTPFTVGRLVENGQVVRGVEAPASWRGGARVPLDPEVRASLEKLVAARDEDGDGHVGIPTWVNLFEVGIVIRQRPDLILVLDGDHALLSLELGLTRRGYDVLRDFEPQATGDAAVDAWLERATDALRRTMPPFRVGKKGGLLVGEAIGACIPRFEAAPAPSPAASDDAAAAGA